MGSAGNCGLGYFSASIEHWSEFVGNYLIDAVRGIANKVRHDFLMLSADFFADSRVHFHCKVRSFMGAVRNSDIVFKQDNQDAEFVGVDVVNFLIGDCLCIINIIFVEFFAASGLKILVE